MSNLNAEASDDDFMKRLFNTPANGEKLDMSGQHNKEWPNPHFEIKKPMANGVIYEGCVCLQPMVRKPNFTDEQKEALHAASVTMLNLTVGMGMNFVETTLISNGRTFKMRIEVREIIE